ncbi:MAG: homoserine dehydrogenase [Tissierellia bacterium]|nr:homoserine dehydrogenase [Tissierellia bacterium]
MKNKELRVALVGLGTVGRGVYDILKEREEQIAATLGRVKIVAVVVTERSRERLQKELPEKVTTDLNSILDEVDVIMEATTSKEAGYEYMKAALEAGKSVITANKSAVSAHFEELSALSRDRGGAFLFEASVGGGIPLITPLRRILHTNDVDQIAAVLNGTCNYLLNRMYDEGAPYEAVLKDAQDLGYAEKDPTDDVEGLDTRRKLKILLAMGMGLVDEEEIPVKGISAISDEIMNYAKNHGAKIKLVAQAHREEDGIAASVGPVLLPDSHPLAILPGAVNALRFTGNYLGDIQLEGPGAGKEPTGGAMVNDLMDLLTGAIYPLTERGPGKIVEEAAPFLVAGPLPVEHTQSFEDGCTITVPMTETELKKQIKEGAFYARVHQK